MNLNIFINLLFLEILRHSCILWPYTSIIQLKVLRKINLDAKTSQFQVKIIENSDLVYRGLNCLIWSLHTVHND